MTFLGCLFDVLTTPVKKDGSAKIGSGIKKIVLGERFYTSAVELDVIFKQNMNFLSDFFFKFILSFVFE